MKFVSDVSYVSENEDTRAINDTIERILRISDYLKENNVQRILIGHKYYDASDLESVINTLIDFA